MHKESVKNYLLISFVVVELLSMIFNYYFVSLYIGKYEYHFNFSVIFFCVGFFIVDIVADQYSLQEANKFVFYKLYCQILFLILGQIAIGVYGLADSQLSQIFNKSAWMIISSLTATYLGVHLMSSIMSYMKMNQYSGGSVFKRYLYSTIPGELLFSFIFTMFCFYTYTTYDELMHVFLTSAIAKIILSVIFALFMDILVKIRFLQRDAKQEASVIKIAN